MNTPAMTQVTTRLMISGSRPSRSAFFAAIQDPAMKPVATRMPNPWMLIPPPRLILMGSK